MYNILPSQSYQKSVITLFVVGVLAASGAAQETPDTSPKPPQRSLQFSFHSTPWREVITWLADSAGLALHVGDVPPGSFTYSDQNPFTPQEALDRINLFLLPEGFALVRSGKLLSLIDVTDRRSARQLDALAELVMVDQLDQLPDHDVAKCIFPLGELSAEDAVEELSALNLMTQPAVFPKTNQLMVTDVVGKLKAVQSILGSFEPRSLDNGTVVKSFTLKHAEAEDILTVARPHLGLATGEMIGIDVSLSADPQGKHIYVTGIEDKVKLVEGLVTAIDLPEQSLSVADGEAELRSHMVESGSVETIYNVLQTLLAGKDVRLSADEASHSIVALATPEVQVEIAQTVKQLQAAGAEFEVIQLKSVDPYFAISLLEEMLDLDELRRQSEAEREALRRRGNESEIGFQVPKIDGDPGSMRLFVRAKRHQIEQIKKIVAGLEESSAGESNGGDQIRILPLRGKQAEQALVTAARFWRSGNPIFFYPSAVATENAERVVASGPEVADDPAAPTVVRRPIVENSIRGQLLTGDAGSSKPAIRCQLLLRGLLLQSEDTQALDQFEQQLRTIVGPMNSASSPPVVFYLKYTKPDDAIRMLAELLDGGESAREGEAGSLVNGYVSTSPGLLWGSLVTSRGGTTTLISGSITVVADSRLNRLVTQGTAADIELIENYLKIVDKDSSMTSIETHGTSQVIELDYARAVDVAAAIRDAYAGRIAGGGEAGSSPKGSSSEPRRRDEGREVDPDENEEDSEQRQRQRGQPGSDAGRSLEPKMTVAVHEPSNSLIVTAPDQLFREVERLAKLIDARSAQRVEVVTMPGTLPFGSLQRILRGGGAAGTAILSGPDRGPRESARSPRGRGEARRETDR